MYLNLRGQESLTNSSHKNSKLDQENTPGKVFNYIFIFFIHSIFLLFFESSSTEREIFRFISSLTKGKKKVVNGFFVASGMVVVAAFATVVIGAVVVICSTS